MFKKTSVNIVILVLLVLIVLNFKKDAEHRYIFSWDYATMFTPWISFWTDSIKNYKALSCWNPYNFCGEPFFANIQVTHLYPFNLLFLIMPLELAFEIKTQLHFILIAIFYFLFFNKIFKFKYSVWFSTITILFSNFFIDNIDNPTVLNAMTYLPLLLFLMYNIFEKNNLSSYLLFGAASLLLLLSAHPQFLFYNILALSGLFIFLCFKYKKVFNIILKFFSLLILVFLISLIQYYPIFESFKNYSRTSGAADFSFYGSLHPAHFITAIIPDFFGNVIDNSFIGKSFKILYSSSNVYEFVGITAVLFFIISLFHIKNKNILLAVISIFVIIFCAAGNYLAFLRIFSYIIIPFKWFREPSRILYLYVIAIATLAGYIIDKFLGSKYSINFNLLTKSILKIIIIILIIINGFLVFKKEFIMTSVVDKILIQKNLSPAKRNIIDNQYYRVTNLSLVLLGKIIIIYLLFIFIKKKNILICGLIIFNFVDLFSFNSKYLVYAKNFKSEECSEILDYLKKDKTLFRVLSLLNTDGYFDKNQNLYLKIHSVKGYNPMILTEFKEFFNQLEKNYSRVYPDTVIGEPDLNLPVLDCAAIKYIISNKIINDTKYKLILYNKDYNQYLYLNKKFLPFFYTVNAVILDEKSIFSKEYNPVKNIFIENFDRSFKHNFTADKDIIDIVKYIPDKIDLTVLKNDKGLLFFSDTYHKNWKCKVDNNEVKIYKANKIFKAVYLEPGIYNVTFYYSLF